MAGSGSCELKTASRVGNNRSESIHHNELNSRRVQFVRCMQCMRTGNKTGALITLYYKFKKVY